MRMLTYCAIKYSIKRFNTLVWRKEVNMDVRYILGFISGSIIFFSSLYEYLLSKNIAFFDKTFIGVFVSLLFWGIFIFIAKLFIK